MKTKQLTAEETLADEITMHDLTCDGREFNLTRTQLNSTINAMRMYALLCCQKVRNDCAENAKNAISQDFITDPDEVDKSILETEIKLY